MCINRMVWLLGNLFGVVEKNSTSFKTLIRISLYITKYSIEQSNVNAEWN